MLRALLCCVTRLTNAPANQRVLVVSVSPLSIDECWPLKLRQVSTHRSSIHSHSKQTRTNQHLQPAGMSRFYRSGGLVKNQTGILNRKTSPDSFTGEAAVHHYKKKKRRRRRRECFGSFCVCSLTERTHSWQRKCCKFCKMWLLMRPDMMKQCLLSQVNVFDPHGNRRDVFSWCFRRKERK